MTNIFVPSKKGPAKLKSVSKPKPATSWSSVDAPPSSRTRGSKRKTTPKLPLILLHLLCTFDFPVANLDLHADFSL